MKLVPGPALFRLDSQFVKVITWQVLHWDSDCPRICTGKCRVVSPNLPFLCLMFLGTSSPAQLAQSQGLALPPLFLSDENVVCLRFDAPSLSLSSLVALETGPFKRMQSRVGECRLVCLS